MAVFEPGSNFDGSTSNTVPQTVNKATTTASLASSRTTSVVGDAVTFVATVIADVPSTRIPKGFVVFKDKGKVLAMVRLDADGKAKFTTKRLLLGTHQITATYVGDDNFFASGPAAHFQRVKSRGRRK